MSFIASAEPVLHQTGFLTLNSSGAILASGGELENDERRSDKIFKLISSQKFESFIKEGCTRVSVNYPNFAYVICLSNKKIHVIKKRIYNNDDDSYSPDTSVPTTNSINA